MLVLLLVLLSGCLNDGTTYFNTSDSTQCVIQCHQKIKENWCMEGYSVYGSMCKCIMMDCLKNVDIEKQPENYTDFRIKRKEGKCYQNGIEVNCKEIDKWMKWVVNHENK
jgi:hypothetical protein